ncbi:hypothetical protein ONE63_007778 [Megalurothrips usitatus]|uniref:Uncharacterized protein n=1 Tax=Megalurothrips usitatus TaxID=439358 RepID=A0AAV7XSV5_9NEOP|nr:hypothetical protein ONE63_007778 [Megalurothrips usitatus]
MFDTRRVAFAGGAAGPVRVLRVPRRRGVLLVAGLPALQGAGAVPGAARVQQLPGPTGRRGDGPDQGPAAGGDRGRGAERHGRRHPATRRGPVCGRGRHGADERPADNAGRPGPDQQPAGGAGGGVGPRRYRRRERARRHGGRAGRVGDGQQCHRLHQRDDRRGRPGQLHHHELAHHHHGAHVPRAGEFVQGGRGAPAGHGVLPAVRVQPRGARHVLAEGLPVGAGGGGRVPARQQPRHVRRGQLLNQPGRRGSARQAGPQGEEKKKTISTCLSSYDTVFKTLKKKIVMSVCMSG